MKLIIAGDYCPRYGLKKIIDQGDYSKIFYDIKRVVSNSDYAIVNLESPVIEGSETPIAKSGPSLGISFKALEAIKYAGFNCVTLANNHFKDYGGKGCINTFNSLKKIEIEYVGAGVDLSDASKVLYINKDECKVAIINVCENEFSIAATDSPGSNPLDLISLYYSLSEARSHANRVVVIVHGGNEHYDYPSPRMKKTYRWLVEMGADAVVNHHQHCYSGYEIYKNRPIVYGLGNFCFDKADSKQSKWQEGYIIELDFKNEGIGLNCIPFVQCRDNYYVRILSGAQSKLFFERLKCLNAVIQDDVVLEQKYDSFMASEMSNKKLCLAPYDNKFFKYACKKGLLPSFISRQRKLFVLAHVQCESLRDVFLYYLKH